MPLVVKSPPIGELKSIGSANGNDVHVFTQALNVT
jgi:hypothetical protein